MARSSESPLLLATDTLQFRTPPRIAFVRTEWNDAIVSELVAGANRAVTQNGGQLPELIMVPGAFELPFGCRVAAQAGADAIIAFGTVIRGGTPHFEYVCKAVTEGITQLNLTLDIPVIFGVLTLNTEAEAWERLGGPHGHKGEEAGIAALKMAALGRIRSITRPS
ncbi:MAG: 6,7-dimethyl-8-ribityllumazine synthase [Sphingobacteriales bacterium]|nr:MAG: 6,7-dimethyl-8-ribityllumazine synthase [Sphingobacteriales bacterium]